MNECIPEYSAVGSDDRSGMPINRALHYLGGSGVPVRHSQGADFNKDQGIGEKRVAEEGCIALSVCDWLSNWGMSGQTKLEGPMNIKTLTAAACLALMSASTSFAATISLDFPSSDSVLHNGGALGAGGGGAFFQTGNSLTEAFAGTGLSNAISSTWNFSMSNFMNTTASAAFNVLINGVVVDSFSFAADRGATESISLSNSFAAISGDDFTLSIVATSTVFGGGGSWNWLPGGTVTLTGDSLSPVPIPAAFPLLLAALGGLGFAARRKAA